MPPTDDRSHTHLYPVPEPLEKLFEELTEIEAAGGPGTHADCARVRASLKEALAAEARGDAPAAVAGIARAMAAIAALAGRVDPGEGEEMRAVAREFERALLRGDANEARSAADHMRARAGARVAKRD